MLDKAAFKKIVFAMCVAIVAGTGWAGENDEVSQFSALNGEYSKKEYLMHLTSVLQQKKANALTATANEQTAVVKVLELGLSEESPVVVEQAVMGIGKLNCVSLASLLIPLYHNAQKRFGGYAERIRIAIIGAVGAMDNNAESVAFLGEELNKDNGTIFGQKILNGIEALHDEQLSGSVSEYAEKMKAIVEFARKRGDNPMLYSNAMQNAALASKVLSSLTNR